MILVKPLTHPVVYNITQLQLQKYNTSHRHLANELRYIPGTAQSVATDTYSVGFLIKRIGHYSIPVNNILFELGKKLKCVDINARITLENGFLEISHL